MPGHNLVVLLIVRTMIALPGIRRRTRPNSHHHPDRDGLAHPCRCREIVRQRQGRIASSRLLATSNRWSSDWPSDRINPSGSSSRSEKWHACVLTGKGRQSLTVTVS